jgi:hypothetical protein
VGSKDFNVRQAGIQWEKKLLGTHERLDIADKNALMACAQTIILISGLFI